jgi:hypothetical protein
LTGQIKISTLIRHATHLQKTKFIPSLFLADAGHVHDHGNAVLYKTERLAFPGRAHVHFSYTDGYSGLPEHIVPHTASPAKKENAVIYFEHRDAGGLLHVYAQRGTKILGCCCMA